MRNWTEWSPGWHAALGQMWEAYCHGCSPIGAAICNADGIVVSAARNTIRDPASGLTIMGHRLAHAEANAILKLSEYRGYSDIHTYTLYTTLEPCPFCFGAIVMGSIRRFEYAARDIRAGSAALNEATPYIRSKNIAVTGPIDGLEPIVFAVKSCFALELPEGRSRDGRIADARTACPAGFAAGERLRASGTLRALRESGKGIEDVYGAAMEALNS